MGNNKTRESKPKLIGYRDDSNITTFKVLIIGEKGTGKTSIMKRICFNYFNEQEKKNMGGVDFGTKLIDIGNNVKIRLKFWDVDGCINTETPSLKLYFAESAIIIYIADMSNLKSLNPIKKWKQALDGYIEINTKTISFLFLNKNDLDESSYQTKNITDFCKQNGIQDWYETSAKNGYGLGDEPLATIARYANNEMILFNESEKEDNYRMCD